jgi:hypothetical protein
MLQKIFQSPLPYTAAFSVLLPLLVGILSVRHVTRPMKILFVLFIYYFVELFVSLYTTTHYKNNLWLAHITTMTQYSAIALVFALWSRSGLAKRAIKASIAIFLLICVLAMLSVEKITHFGTFTTPLGGLLLASMGVFTLVGLATEYESKIFHDQRFWVSASVVLYFLGTASIFAMYEVVGKFSTREDFYRFYAVNWTLSIVANILYAVAFFVASRSPRKDNGDLSGRKSITVQTLKVQTPNILRAENRKGQF